MVCALHAENDKSAAALRWQLPDGALRVDSEEEYVVMKAVYKTAVAVVFALVAGQANAGFVVFNLGGANANLGSTESITVGGFTLNVAAFSRTTASTGAGTARSIIRRGNGFGVAGGGSNQVNNSNRTDWLSFDTTAGRIVEVTLALLTSNEVAQFGTSSTASGLFTTAGEGPVSTSSSPITVPLTWGGQWLNVGAIAPAGTTATAFRVSSVKVVPVPGTLLLLGGGLLGLGCLRRRATA